MLKIQTENLEKQLKKKIKHAIRKEEKENVQKKIKSVQCNSIEM